MVWQNIKMLWILNKISEIDIDFLKKAKSNMNVLILNFEYKSY